MAEHDKQVQVEVRSLAGESTVISISPTCTIEELKLLLKQSFVPAQTSQNFHLFFKGSKMMAKSSIASYSINNANFIVFVPFTKKSRIQIQDQPSEPITTPPRTSSFADSAWSDLMQDFSSLSDPSMLETDVNEASQIKNDHKRVAFGEERVTCLRSSNSKRKRDLERDRSHEDVLTTILCSDNVSSEKIIEASEQLDCLSDPETGRCSWLTILRSVRGKSCVCPPWLKIILKTFSFLNVLAGFLKLQQLELTLDRLEGAIQQLKRFGLEIGVTDIEHLSILCPQIIKFGDQGVEAVRLSEAICISNPAKELKDPSDAANNHTIARKSSSISAAINTIKKREISFKRNLLGAFQITMGKTRSAKRLNMLSLEDLLHCVKHGDTITRRSIVKKAGASQSIESSSQSGKIHCQDTHPLKPIEMVEHLRKVVGANGQIVHVEEINARKASYVGLPIELSEMTKSALKRLGVSRLYSHQADSIQASLSGKNVIVATMTSSGKSLCYNIPVLEVLSQNFLSCALYIFPTKALAQDQLRTLLAMTEGLDLSLNIGVFDGDTSQEGRQWLRDNSRLLITNPDMLHMSILPFHRQFQRILSNLRFIVIDEAHAYKGAFGCHTALVLRRLRRLCSYVYGSDPLFVFSTATSANPREHALELAGLTSVELIQNDGSPCGPKLFVLWNPPFLHAGSKFSSKIDQCEPADIENCTRRSSPILEVSYLMAEMVQHGLHCIAFCKSRKLSELVLCYTREILQEVAPHLVDTICAYRAGYIPQDRRKIESEFFGGRLRGIAATNALELGIDVGDVDATLHLGFPGSFSSLWQQAGRSGRRGKPSIAVYVAFEGPLDQYYMKFPGKLFKSPIECCLIDAKNKQVLEQHLICAAHEHSLNLLYDEKYFGPGLHSAILTLSSKGYLCSDSPYDSSSRIWSYIGHEKKPSHAISLRAIESEKYKVIEQKRNEVLEEIEVSRAFFQVYEGAVYLHQGKTYIVKSLDLSAKIALCQEADLKYYTKTRDYTDVYVLNGNIAYPTNVCGIQQSRTNAQVNNCTVTTTWFGFFRIWRGSKEIFDSVELSLPKYSYESQAVWVRVPQQIKIAVETQKMSFRAGLHAACHALLHVVPLFIQCNASDLASECANPHDKRYFPERLLLYDRHSGGSGISSQVQPIFGELLTAALELLEACGCNKETGCPNCIQLLSCGEYNEVLEKNCAVAILKGVIEAELFAETQS